LGFSAGEIMFIKHGDGKIVAVIEEEDLTEDQKLAADELKKQVIKKSVKTDPSNVKKSGS
jgi:hypothetical protein